MIDTSVLTVTHQGASSLANTLPNFSKLVTALRDCLSPQQVRKVLKGRARGW